MNGKDWLGDLNYLIKVLNNSGRQSEVQMVLNDPSISLK